MKIKAGYRTSEFWFTVVSFIFSGLFLLGIIGDYSHKEELIRDVSHAVESVILIGGQLFVLYRYVKGRSEIKKIAEEEELELIRKAVTNDKQRNDTKRSKRNSTTNKRVSTKSKKTSNK